MRRKRYSIREIAEASGVAPSTVSRVLNGSGYVSADTEKRVREVIERVGYTPSQIARGLRVGHSPTIGILVPDIVGEFFTSFSMELHTALFRRSYIPVLLNTEAISDVEAEVNRIQSALNPSGWVRVLVPPHPDRPRTPTVYVDCPVKGLREGEALVHNDNLQIGYLATRELIERGSRHIAMLIYNRMPGMTNSRYQGYQKALREAGLAEDPALVVECDSISYDAGYACAQRLLREAEHVDGIFCMGDRFVPGVLMALGEHGRRVPEDVRVVGCDDSPISRYVHGGFTTVHRYLDKLADAAADALVTMITG
ncbi:LacI family transcriptional regulator, partial [Eubacteriales bacterium OttesenSCG-928-A19]|nr:LacI family transcriptional regulator [Eubacteriales bacterium OttesenSCG-928-A19]